MYRIVMTVSAPTEERAKQFAEELEAVAASYWDDVGRDVALVMSTALHRGSPDPTRDDQPQSAPPAAVPDAK